MAVIPRPVRALARAQALDVLRQRGVWRTLALLPLVYLFAVQVLPAAADTRSEDRRPLLQYRLAVAGDREDAASLLQRLDEGRFIIEDVDDAASAVNDADSYLGMRVNVAGGPLEDGGRIQVVVYIITTLEPSRTGGALLFAQLQEVSDGLASVRVAEVGSDLEVPVVATEVLDLSETATRGRTGLARSMPLLLLISLLPNVRHLGGPLRGGHGSGGPLEGLLVLPVSRGTILAAMGLAGLALAGVVTVVITAGVAAVAVSVDALGRAVGPVAPVVVRAGLATALTAMPVVALGLVAGAYARTDDEASRFELLLAPLFVIGLLGQLDLGLGGHPLVLAVPVVGPAVGAAELVAGELAASGLVVMVLSSVAATAMLLAIADRLLARERAVVGAA